jgi:hypothetical protein
MSIFEINLQDTCACSEKYSNKLDISRSLISIFAVITKILALAVKNIQASLIFLARLSVSLQ